jgi:hypothetical protein
MGEAKRRALAREWFPAIETTDPATESCKRIPPHANLVKP